jgi:hypothetical protein
MLASTINIPVRTIAALVEASVFLHRNLKLLEINLEELISQFSSFLGHLLQ